MRAGARSGPVFRGGVAAGEAMLRNLEIA